GLFPNVSNSVPSRGIFLLRASHLVRVTLGQAPDGTIGPRRALGSAIRQPPVFCQVPSPARKCRDSPLPRDRSVPRCDPDPRPPSCREGRRRSHALGVGCRSPHLRRAHRRATSSTNRSVVSGGPRAAVHRSVRADDPAQSRSGSSACSAARSLPASADSFAGHYPPIVKATVSSSFPTFPDELSHRRNRASSSRI